MKPEAQRIAIAEACGKRYHKPTPEEVASGSYYQYEPDYLNDLNAMHEAEKVLTREQRWDFINHLNQDTLCFISSRVGERTCDVYWRLSHATAAQRAEAFLRTIGKWKSITSMSRDDERPE